MFSPLRHQGHQAHPTTRFEPRRTQRAQSRPPALNTKTQRRKGAKPTQPPIWPTDHTDPPTHPRRNAEAQRRRESFAGFACLARFPTVRRPGIAGRASRPENELSNRLPRPAITPLRLCVFAGWRGGRALRSLRFKNGRAGGICVICVICGQIGRVGGSVPSVPLWFSWCPPLVSWCLGGSKATRHS